MTSNVILGRTGLEQVLQTLMESSTGQRILSMAALHSISSDTLEDNDVHLVARENPGVSCTATNTTLKFSKSQFATCKLPLKSSPTSSPQTMSKD